MRFVQNHKIQSGFIPVADAYETDTNKINTDVFNMSEYNHITFIIHEGAGATGTATITVLSCDDVTPSNSTAIVFDYSYSTTFDTYTDLATATTSGLATTAGASDIYVIEVDATQLASRSGVKDQYVQLVASELVDAAVTVGCIVIQSEPRNMSDASDMRGALT